MRPGNGRDGVLLGMERERPAWRRDERLRDRPEGPGGGDWWADLYVAGVWPVSHLWPDVGRDGVLLGIQRVRPAWRRDEREQTDVPGGGEWRADLHGAGGGYSSHVWPGDGRDGVLLGMELGGPAWRRDEWVTFQRELGQPAGPGGGEWRADVHGAGGGHISHVWPGNGRDGVLLGIQRERPAWRRDEWVSLPQR